VPLSSAAGGSYVGDLSIPVIGRDLCAEVKVRGNGFTQLYEWLERRDLLIVRADRREPLVLVPLRLAAEIAAAAEHHKSITTKFADRRITAPALRRHLTRKEPDHAP
jgi:hypothetical protein